MPDNPFPAPAFFFRLVVGADSALFLEVSGIGPEIEVEDVQEGGENRFHHRLPKPPKQRNLELKRGMIKTDGELLKWYQSVFEGGSSTRIETKTVRLELVGSDDEQQPLRIWIFHDAWPVKWGVDPFNAKGNEVTIETLELSYTFSERG